MDRLTLLGERALPPGLQGKDEPAVTSEGGT